MFFSNFSASRLTQLPINIIAVSLFLSISTATGCDTQSAQPIDSLLQGFFSGSGDSGDPIQIANNFHRIVTHDDETRATRKRSSSLNCQPNESCDSLRAIPFCYDTLTADWHAGDDTAGNGITGDYVLRDGRKGNLYDGPLPASHDAAPTRTTDPAGEKSGGSGSDDNSAEKETQSPTPARSAATFASPSPKTTTTSSGAIGVLLTYSLRVVLTVAVTSATILQVG